jgi:hypothetical protein
LTAHHAARRLGSSPSRIGGLPEFLTLWLSAPAAMSVKAAAAEQQNQHDDNQQEFHGFLQKRSQDRLLEVGLGRR